MKARRHLLEAADQLAGIVREDPRRASGVDEPRKPRLLTDDVVLGGGLLGRGTSRDILSSYLLLAHRKAKVPPGHPHKVNHQSWAEGTPHAARHYRLLQVCTGSRRRSLRTDTPGTCLLLWHRGPGTVL